MRSTDAPPDLDLDELKLAAERVIAALSPRFDKGDLFSSEEVTSFGLARGLRTLLSALDQSAQALEEAERERDNWKRTAEHHFGHMRAALDLSYAIRWPADPEFLDLIADQIDCGGECDTAWREWDTNATGCTRSDSAEGCPFEHACRLRDFAKAMRIHAWTLAFAPPPESRATEAERQRDEARAGERNMAEHARRVADEANEAFAAAAALDEFWEACGYPSNRGTLTPAEQVSSINRERDEAVARAERAEKALGEARNTLDRILGMSRMTREQFMGQGPAFACRIVERVAAIAREGIIASDPAAPLTAQPQDQPKEKTDER